MAVVMFTPQCGTRTGPPQDKCNNTRFAPMAVVMFTPQCGTRTGPPQDKCNNTRFACCSVFFLHDNVHRAPVIKEQTPDLLLEVFFFSSGEVLVATRKLGDGGRRRNCKA